MPVPRELGQPRKAPEVADAAVAAAEAPDAPEAAAGKESAIDVAAPPESADADQTTAPVPGRKPLTRVPGIPAAGENQAATVQPQAAKAAAEMDRPLAERDYHFWDVAVVHEDDDIGWQAVLDVQPN